MEGQGAVDLDWIAGELAGKDVDIFELGKGWGSDQYNYQSTFNPNDLDCLLVVWSEEPVFRGIYFQESLWGHWPFCVVAGYYNGEEVKKFYYCPPLS